MMKERMMKAVKEYRKKHCDNKGNIRFGNPTETQRKGLKECQMQDKNNNLVYYIIDKS